MKFVIKKKRKERKKKTHKINLKNFKLKKKKKKKKKETHFKVLNMDKEFPKFSRIKAEDIVRIK